MDDTRQTLKELLQEALRGDARVLVACVFGSWARGKPRARSDVDVALYLDPATCPDQEAAFAAWRDYTDQLTALTGREVDVLILNEAPPTLASTALRGERLLVRDERLYLDLLCDATRDAEDMRAWLFNLFQMREERRARQVSPTGTPIQGKGGGAT